MVNPPKPTCPSSASAAWRITSRDRSILGSTVYTQRLGFGVEMHPGPGFALLSRGDLRLLLNSPRGGGGAGQSMPEGRRPEPGGWNRIQIEVDDLTRTVDQL